jgi:hypothetical protein
MEKVIETIFIDDTFLQSSGFKNMHNLFFIILQVTAILLLLSLKTKSRLQKFLW